MNIASLCEEERGCAPGPAASQGDNMLLLLCECTGTSQPSQAAPTDAVAPLSSDEGALPPDPTAQLQAQVSHGSRLMPV